MKDIEQRLKEITKEHEANKKEMLLEGDKSALNEEFIGYVLRMMHELIMDTRNELNTLIDAWNERVAAEQKAAKELEAMSFKSKSR